MQLTPLISVWSGWCVIILDDLSKPYTLQVRQGLSPRRLLWPLQLQVTSLYRHGNFKIPNFNKTETPLKTIFSGKSYVFLITGVPSGYIFSWQNRPQIIPTLTFRPGIYKTRLNAKSNNRLMSTSVKVIHCFRYN